MVQRFGSCVASFHGNIRISRWALAHAFLQPDARAFRLISPENVAAHFGSPRLRPVARPVTLQTCQREFVRFATFGEGALLHLGEENCQKAKPGLELTLLLSCGQSVW